MNARSNSSSSSARNRRDMRTLEEIFIEKVLGEAEGVAADLAGVLAVVLLQNGSTSDAFKHVETRLRRVSGHVENSNRALTNLLNLIGETAIVGNLSHSEMKHRCSVLIERLGVEEVMEIIHQLESKRELPDNVSSFSKYKLKKEKAKILGSNKPKGAA